MTSQKTTFDEWMKELDKVLSSNTGGITHHDLPDADYRGYFDDLVKEILSDWNEYTEASLRSHYEMDIAELVDDDPNVILTADDELEIILKHLKGQTKVITMVNTSHHGGYPVDYYTFLVKESQ